jgi:glycosyltransferase involved in cell wall biosynthesis
VRRRNVPDRQEAGVTRSPDQSLPSAGLRKWRLAVVVQRYGHEVAGGAELHARLLAERLLPWADVCVLTTCALDYTTWANHYPPGESTLDGVRLRRYLVDRPRDWIKAQKATGRLIAAAHTYGDELDWMREQGPWSSALLDAIQSSYPHFDAFIFFTYHYAPTFYGLPLVSDKAILVPTAHDDPFIRLPLFRSLFHLPQAIVYNTDVERKLVNRLTANHQVPHVVAGVGVNLPADLSAARFRARHAIHDPFILYVGRLDASKNVPQLLEYFERYRRDSARPLKLVLAGKPFFDLPPSPDVIPVGFLSEGEKFDAIQAAELIVMPSLYESLSMIVLEAWRAGRPVLVNGRCEVLKDQCRRSNGGLYYLTYDEFAATLSLLLTSPTLRQRLGQNGRHYVAQAYSWDTVLAKYRALLDILTHP